MKIGRHTHRLTVLCLASFTAFATDAWRPTIVPANFTHIVNNPWFPLVPGTTAVFHEQNGRERRENKVSVTHETKIILGVKCVVVHETVALDGALIEDTYDWFAQDRQGAVWHFGEATKEFKSGGRVSTDGSWEVGVNDAQPGIVMPARPKVGERYRQNYLAHVAEDIGQIVTLDETITVPAGTYPGCVRVREWSMLESGTSKKWYATGVGLIRAESTDGEVTTLVSLTRK